MTWLTADQAAALLGYRVATVRRLACDGVLPAYKPAGTKAWHFDAEELADWLRSGRNARVRPAPVAAPTPRPRVARVAGGYPLQFGKFD